MLGNNKLERLGDIWSGNRSLDLQEETLVESSLARVVDFGRHNVEVHALDGRKVKWNVKLLLRGVCGLASGLDTVGHLGD